ncbi:glycine-rich domain-containing protein [Nocardia sp. NPDC055002]
MTTPGQPPADGAYVIGGGEYDFGKSLTESIGMAIMTGGIKSSFGGARDKQYEHVGGSIVDHETRISVLEDGSQIAEFFGNDTWTKPASMQHHRFYVISGGGGGYRPNANDTEIGYGGGQGGFSITTLLDADVEATLSVIVGAGGAGSTSRGFAGQPGGQSRVVDSGGAIAVAGPGLGGGLGPPQAGTGTEPVWQANGGHGAGKSGSAYPNNASSGGNGINASGGGAGFSGSYGAGNGGHGQDAPDKNLGPGAGGGGGGHAYGIGNGAWGGVGGHGGAPGGGGGGGGQQSGDAANVTGNGGNGANGRVWIISSPFPP